MTMADHLCHERSVSPHGSPGCSCILTAEHVGLHRCGRGCQWMTDPDTSQPGGTTRRFLISTLEELETTKAENVAMVAELAETRKKLDIVLAHKVELEKWINDIGSKPAPIFKWSMPTLTVEELKAQERKR